MMMDLVELVKSRVDRILDVDMPDKSTDRGESSSPSYSSGMKVLLMDADTTISLSLSCPQSSIMKREVFLFENLHNLRPVAANAGQNWKAVNHNKLAFMKCVVLIRPDTDNVRMLAKELAWPRYGSYYVFFTNRIQRADLKLLAESDVHEVVRDVKEVPSDFTALEPHAFTLVGIRTPPIRNLRYRNYFVHHLLNCQGIIQQVCTRLKTFELHWGSWVMFVVALCCSGGTGWLSSGPSIP